VTKQLSTLQSHNITLSPASDPATKGRSLQSYNHIIKSSAFSKMAAAIKAINARIRANPVTDYICSTRKSSLALQDRFEL
jgi:hypothetical protein